MNKFTRISAFAVLTMGLSACAGSTGSSMNTGQRLTERGGQITQYGDEWSAGKKSVRDGEKLDAKSADTIADARKMLAKAEADQRRAEAEAAVEAKSAYIAAISHELRTPISAILTPVLTTSANAVDMRITAGLYRNVIASGQPVQSSYAGILDSNRSAAGTFSDVYLRTDLMSAAQIQATFEGLAPFTESTRLNLGEAMLSSTSRVWVAMSVALLGGPGHGFLRQSAALPIV